MDNKNNYERNNLSDPDDNTRSHMASNEPETNLTRQTPQDVPAPSQQVAETTYFSQQNPFLVNLNNSAQLNFLRNQNHFNQSMYQVSNSPRPAYRAAPIMDTYSHPGVFPNMQSSNLNMTNITQSPSYVNQHNLYGVRSSHPGNVNDGTFFSNMCNNSASNPNCSQTLGSIPEHQTLNSINIDSLDPGSNVGQSVQNTQSGMTPVSLSSHHSQPITPNYMLSQVNMSDNTIKRPLMARSSNTVNMNPMPINHLGLNQMNMNSMGGHYSCSNSMGMNPVCASPMPIVASASNNQTMSHQMPSTPITVATPQVNESNLNQTVNYAHSENLDANNHHSSSRMSGHMNTPHLQAGGQSVSVHNNTMPQLSHTNIPQDPNYFQNRLTQLAIQIQQTQMTLATMTNSNPQNVAAIQFLSNRLNQMKNVYVQLNSAQQQQMQQQQMQRGMMAPTIQPQGFIPSFNHNPQNMSALQQQMLQNQYQSMQMGSMAPLRGNMIPSRFPMRMNTPSIQSNMMMPPGLTRYQGNRPFITSNSNYMLSSGNIRGSMHPDSTRGGRRNLKHPRRKRPSSESEEEEEITTSEADSISDISPSDIQVDFIEPRRSTRKRVNRSYIPDIVDDSDGEEKSKKDNDSVLANQQDLIPFQPNEQIEGKIMLIERILADRFRALEEGEDVSTASEGILQEYYIKFKCYSYLHCEWCSESELKKRDKNAISKIRRYKAKKKESPFLYMDEDPFNPDYIEIDRILDVKVTTDVFNPDQKVNCYLVKWCALPYDESTWEFEEVVDEFAIKQFHQRNTLPPPEELLNKPKPNVYAWQKIQKSPMYKNDNVLRDYQLEGINWLMYEYHCGTNCILADEKKKKTIQSIAFLVEVKRAGIRGPFLIIAPLSTIGNWYREFLSWSDFNVVVFHGAASSRHIIHRYELNFRNEHDEIIPDVCKFEVLITTYEMILSENKFLSSVRWRIAIVDEAHRLKNRRCKLLGNLSNIYTEHRVLLTGTPLQNTLDELLSLLNFLDPARAEALETMISQEAGGRLETNTQVQQIQSVLKPVILRRLKEDVEKNIAPKEETIIEVEMTSIQKKVYRGILERNLSFLTKGTTSTNLPNLMNIMMELRKCCNHPFLNNGVEDKILAEFSSAHPSLDRQTMYRKALIESSGKMVLVDKLLPKLRDSGHKMLIFSQMVRVLDIIEEYLLSNGFAFERIDGSVRGNLRQAAIDRFSKPDSDRSVFLLCTKAGGLGINLTAADTVIIFDSDWNPQNDIQAQARCHRIGQNKAVKVYRLICRKTYEREMFDRASLKLGLDKAVLQDINYTNTEGKPPLPGARAQLSKKDVEELLRRGAYAAVMDEDTEASAQFCSEDIDQILERRATVIKIAGEIKGSTFAKASFNAEISGDQVDIDDPDFWQKWAKTTKVSSAGDSKLDFVDDKPRIRKSVRSVQDVPGDDLEFVNETSGRRNLPIISQRTSWFKKECLKVEKYLLVYGWGRWADIFNDCGFKSNMNHHDVQQISKTILVIAWNVVKASDNSFNDFVEKAIRLTTLKNRVEQDSDDFNYRPYGRKRTRSKRRETSKKNEKSKLCLYQTSSDWKNQDIDTLVFDLNYKKHLIHCASKILIRMRLLFHIEYYILRDCKEDVLAGVNIHDINVPLIPASRNSLTLPDWWDYVCDRSLIVGIFKHGFEKYPYIVADVQLCFSTHLNLQSSVSAPNELVSRKRGCRKRRAVNVPASSDENIDLDSPSTTQIGSSINAENSISDTSKYSGMPNNADLNTYTKRLVMLYWKNRSKTQSKPKVNADLKTTKWTRKEEADFYKALTVYGVEYDTDGIIIWDGFRKHGKFEKKDDNSMSLYLDALVRKCLSILNPDAQAVSTDPDTVIVFDGFLNYEKSEKVLKFMELFELIRKALRVQDIALKIKSIPNCCELPDWWTIEHDIDLLRASALYGIDQTDKRIFYDDNFSFNSVVKRMHDNLINSKELIQSGTDAQDINSLSVDMLKSIISWPKFKVILNRLYALSMYVTTSTWHPVFEIVIGNLIEKSRQLMQNSCQSENVNQTNIVADTHDSPQLCPNLSPLDKPSGQSQTINITRQALG